MNRRRFLVVNADDLGMTEAVNEGIFAAHLDGVVTSSSLMVFQTAAPAARDALDSMPRLAVGLHLDLGGRDYAADVPPTAEHRCDIEDPVAVERECRAQLERFRELTGREPTHLDSHKHVHDSEPVASVARCLANELGVPLRGVTMRYEGSFYGRDDDGARLPESITPTNLIRLVDALPSGWTEIGCHPAAGPVRSSYDAERQTELRTLCDPAIRTALTAADVELRSFADAPRPTLP